MYFVPGDVLPSAITLFFYLFWESLAFAFVCGYIVLLVHSYPVVVWYCYVSSSVLSVVVEMKICELLSEIYTEFTPSNSCVMLLISLVSLQLVSMANFSQHTHFLCQGH